MRLTDQKIRSLKPARGKLVEYSDDGYPLYVTVSNTGLKNFVWRGRVSGKTTRRKIGEYETMTLADARLIALEMKREASHKLLEPVRTHLERQRDSEKGHTVNQVFAMYMENEGNLTKTAGERWQMYDRDIAPYIGHKFICDIQHDDLAAIVEAKYLKSQIASNRVQSLMSRFFRWCLTKGRTSSGLTQNPAQYVVKLAKENIRKRWLSEYEIGLFFRALPAAGAFAPVFETLLYTLCRKSELMLSEPTNFDDEDALKIVLHNTKNGLEHAVWLHPAIEGYFKRSGDRCFTVSKAATSNPMKRLNKRMRELAEQDGKEFERFRLHDLRRTGASWMDSFCDDEDMPLISEETKDKVLNHAPESVRGRHYNMWHGFAQKKAAWKIYGDFLTKIKDSI